MEVGPKTLNPLSAVVPYFATAQTCTLTPTPAAEETKENRVEISVRVGFQGLYLRQRSCYIIEGEGTEI